MAGTRRASASRWDKGFPGPPNGRLIALLVAVAVAVDGTAIYLSTRDEGPPSFRAGGAFDTAPASPASPEAEPAPAPATTLVVPPAGAATTTTAARPGSGSSVTTTTTAPVAGAVGAAGAVVQALSPPPSSIPALGVYTYELRGSENATVLGSRALGPQMTVTAHGAAGLAPNQVVLDYVFSPTHVEREIVTYDDTGISFAFEGGSVTFGPVNQTSQSDFSPGLVQVPLPLAAGASRRGTSTALDAAGGGSRVEDWTAEVLRQETVTVAGQPVATWVVRSSRQTRPDSADQLTRTRTYWYDPVRHIWVKWQEHFDGHRSLLGLDFGFTADFEATLAAVP